MKTNPTNSTWPIYDLFEIAIVNHKIFQQILHSPITSTGDFASFMKNKLLLLLRLIWKLKVSQTALQKIAGNLVYIFVMLPVQILIQNNDDDKWMNGFRVVE